MTLSFPRPLRAVRLWFHGTHLRMLRREIDDTKDELRAVADHDTASALRVYLDSLRRDERVLVGKIAMIQGGVL